MPPPPLASLAFDLFLCLSLSLPKAMLSEGFGFEVLCVWSLSMHGCNYNTTQRHATPLNIYNKKHPTTCSTATLTQSNNKKY